MVAFAANQQTQQAVDTHPPARSIEQHDQTDSAGEPLDLAATPPMVRRQFSGGSASIDPGMTQNHPRLSMEEKDVNQRESFQSFLNAATRNPADTMFHPLLARSVGPSKFGAAGDSTGRARPPSRGFRPPSGILAPSTLYTVVISPTEMAAYEATNFKNVKGVYKNCRGIWAAQWTDERGQRHTKYFNPKYYASEAEARHEAFKFKVHIAREIELRGGVQKRRMPKLSCLPGTIVKPSDSFMEIPYMRERQKRPTAAKRAKTRNSALMEPDGGISSGAGMMGYTALGFDPSHWFRSANAVDFLMLEHSNQRTGAQPQQQQQSGKDLSGLGGIITGTEEFDGSALLSNSTCSPLSAASNGRSPQTTLLYNPQTFDSIFLPPSAASAAACSNHPYLSLSSNTAAVSSSNPSSILYRLNNGQFPSSSSSSDSPSSAAGPPLVNSPPLPPGTSFCLCGCGELAISPGRFASHHQMAIQPSPDSKPAFVSAVASGATEGPAASLFSSFPASSYDPDSAAAPFSLNKKRKAREESSDSQPSGENDEKIRRRRPAESLSSRTEDASSASSSSMDSWIKLYPPYSTYPTSNTDYSRQQPVSHNEHIPSSISIATLLDQVTRGQTETGENSIEQQWREAAMVLLTSTNSSLTDEGLNSYEQQQFVSDLSRETVPRTMESADAPESISQSASGEAVESTTLEKTHDDGDRSRSHDE